jgi:PTS system nitrogen regulatory IIA component
MKEDALLTIREVAKYLHVVQLTVYRMIKRGDLKAIKVGRVWRVRREDLERYVNRPAPRDVDGKGAES